MKKGFTLIEILVYMAVLAIIILAVLSFFLWMMRFNVKTKAMQETLNSTRTVMKTMSREIKEARNINISASVFDVHPGKLSLETVSEGEYIDFYLCGGQICSKRGSQQPIFLTPDNVEVNNLIFTKIGGAFPSVQIDLKIDYKNPANKPENNASVNLISTVSPRIIK